MLARFKLFLGARLLPNSCLMADELSDVAAQFATRPGSASRDCHNGSEDLVDSQEWAFVEQACVLHYCAWERRPRRKGLAPYKVVRVLATNSLEARDWWDVPCRYGFACRKRGWRVAHTCNCVKRATDKAVLPVLAR